MHWPRIRGLCSVSCSVWLRANGTEISTALWAVRLGNVFTHFYFFYGTDLAVYAFVNCSPVVFCVINLVQSIAAGLSLVVIQRVRWLGACLTQRLASWSSEVDEWLLVNTLFVSLLTTGYKSCMLTAWLFELCWVVWNCRWMLLLCFVSVSWLICTDPDTLQLFFRCFVDIVILLSFLSAMSETLQQFSAIVFICAIAIP